MNKLRIVLVTLMVSILLSACGNSQTASSNQHGGDVIENKNTAQLSNDEVTEENSAENNGIELLTRDGDKANFTPITEDYVYAVKQKVEGEGVEYEVVILISFDENGKRVQWVERNISGEDTTYTNLYEEGYVAEEPNSVWTDKYCVLADLPEGRLDGSAIDGDYYYSKELTSQQTTFDNLYSEGDFIDLSTFPHVTDDYILWQSNEKITVEGYVNTGRPRPGSRREVQGIIMYDNDYTVEEYGAFSYNEYSIECFDETGTEVGYMGIRVMDSAEMVESYLKYSGFSVWDEVSPKTDVDWEMVRESGLQVDEKYIWQEYNDFEPAKKSDFAVFDTDKIYFSKPYLTDSQIKALRTW